MLETLGFAELNAWSRLDFPCSTLAPRLLCACSALAQRLFCACSRCSALALLCAEWLQGFCVKFSMLALLAQRLLCVRSARILRLLCDSLAIDRKLNQVLASAQSWREMETWYQLKKAMGA